MKNSLQLIVTILMMIVAGSVMGQSIFTNPITGTNPNLSNPYTTGQVVASNMTAGGIGRGTGIAGVNTNDRYNANSWNTVGLDTAAYFNFTLTPSSGFKINLLSFVYTGQASGTGPSSFALRSSVDGFTANIGTPTAGGTTISLIGSPYQNLTSEIEFRFYGWGASASGGTYSINDFTFNGTVVATAPEIQLQNPINTDIPCGSTVDMGNVEVNANANTTVRIKNIGLANLILDGLPFPLGGANADQFSITTQPTSTISVAGYSDMIIEFSPDASGPKTASISIENNDSNEDPCIVNLSGFGVCIPPSTQATNFGTNNILHNQMNITWVRGNGANVLVVARQGGAVNADPVNGTTYTANAAFGSGTQIGMGNYVVYSGTGTSETVTALMANTAYHYAIYEFDGGAGSECYRTSDELTGSATTLSLPPVITHTGTSPAASNINQGSLNTILYQIDIAVADNDATLTQLVVTTAGTWDNNDLVNFKLRYSTDATLDVGDATLDVEIVLAGGTQDITFAGFSQNIPIGTRYLFVTCDVDPAATVNNTIAAGPDANTDFTYSENESYSGSSFAAANAKTIIGTPEIQLEYPIASNAACGFTLPFGNVVVNASNSLTVRIRNTGSADLTLSPLPTIGGADPSQFSITTPPSSPIAAGGFSDMVVQFLPTSTGAKTASILIDNNDSDENPCSISLTGTGILANDNCSGAIELTVDPDESCGANTNGTTVGATQSFAAILCNLNTGNADDDVWYSFEATGTSHIITVDGAANMDAVIDLREGACDGTNIACADVTFGGDIEILTATGLTNGSTYYIRIYDYDSGSGDFTICITTPEPPSYFRTQSSGLWSDAGIWQTSVNNMDPWVNASLPPTLSDLSITIRDMDDVTINAVTTIEEVVVESGGILSIAAGITVNNGTGDDIVIQDGGRVNYKVSTWSYNSGARMRISTSGILSIETSGITGAGTGVNSVNHIYEDASILQWNNPSGTISSSGVTYFPNVTTEIPIFRFVTGVTGTPGSSNPTEFKGLVQLGDGVSITWTASGAKIFRNGIVGLGASNTMTGNSGSGAWFFDGTTATIGSESGTLTLTHVNTIHVGSNVNSVTAANLIGTTNISSVFLFSIRLNCSLTCGAGDILTCGTTTFTGDGTFILASGGTIRTAHVGGLYGTLGTSLIKTLDSGGNYEFNGGTQATSIYLPSSISGALIISNNSTTTLTNDVTLTGTAHSISSGSSFIVPTGKVLTNNGTITQSGTLTINGTMAGTGTVAGNLSNNTAISPGNSAGTLTVSGNYTAGASSTTNIELGGASAGQFDVLAVGGTAALNGTLNVTLINGYTPANGAKFLFLTHGSGSGSFTTQNLPAGYTWTLNYLSNGVELESGGPLPIELTHFDATLLEKQVALTWTTATEINNEYFLVQHSADGRNYTDIGMVPGAGTTTQAQSYSYQHQTPTRGANYYRLQQVDYDGAFSFSPIRVVELGGVNTTTADNWSIRPTIASDQINLLRQGAAGAATWTVFTMEGRPALRGQFPADSDVQPIDISALHSGPYFLQVISREGVWSGRIVRE